ncbi:MAG: acyl-CoA dehydrogenase family protein [Gammaproteobacteria bacterium]|nr:acyl-CoA dehydrogenase family protein [Gammaproteobacteria bacterium]
MDFGLTAEQQMVVDTVRDFVERELYPHEEAVERTGRVAPELGESIKRKVLELGFYAPNLPVEVGGGGLDHLTFTLLERELGRASMALTVFWGRPSGILMACNAEQRARYLLPSARGERFDALAMTEPGAGSDVRGMQCFAKPDGDDWILNGTKHFISHADVADFAIVFVATGEEDTARGPKKLITCFLVDRGTPGFDIRPGYDSVSHRGYHNAVLVFDNCRLPSVQILGEPHRGFELANEWLYGTRLTVAAMCVGRARRAFDLALAYAAEREQFGQAIGRFQGVSFKLADMITEIDAADWMTLAAAWRLDRGLPANREIASAKLYASEMLARVTDEAVQIHGGMGLMSDLPLARFWRDARVERIWDGTSEIQRHIIGRDLLRPLGA